MSDKPPVFIDDCAIQYGRMKMAHMWSPSVERLDEVALAVGLKLKWRQEKKDYFIHYDLCQAKRKQAIERGLVIPVKVRDLIATVSPNISGHLQLTPKELANKYKKETLFKDQQNQTPTPMNEIDWEEL